MILWQKKHNFALSLEPTTVSALLTGTLLAHQDVLWREGMSHSTLLYALDKASKIIINQKHTPFSEILDEPPLLTFS